MGESWLGAVSSGLRVRGLGAGAADVEAGLLLKCDCERVTSPASPASQVRKEQNAAEDTCAVVHVDAASQLRG